MAKLNLEYYPNDNKYTDGTEVEARLLQIVREGKDLDSLDPSEVSFPIYYHLSPFRENICSWYPFSPEARVLEIGSGCGAITGILCRRVKEVVSVELSLDRAKVNEARNRAFDNLSIYVGDLNDMEFDEPFDDVVLIGVLEYAGRFTKGDDPYCAFLKKIGRFLKPDGRILMAIENRLGLKYFAGAFEDHLHQPFIGLKNYPDGNLARTFSKTELTELLRRSGFAGARFYYPYPDYKFPVEIFTDETLRFQGYGKPFNVLDEDRIELFPEAAVSADLAKEGVAACFANSFFVEAAFGEEGVDKRILYAKLNRDRKEEYQIATVISRENGTLRVEKRALTLQAAFHLERILRNEDKQSERCRVIRGERRGQAIVYPYESHSTLAHWLETRGNEGDFAAIREAVGRLIGVATKGAARKAYGGEAFEAWFGPAGEGEETLCVDDANIDLIPANIFMVDGELVATDCEWVTDFPVPVSYIVWRILEEVYRICPRMETAYPKAAWQEACGIQADMLPLFTQWDGHFVNAHVSTMRNIAYRKRLVPLSNESWNMVQAQLSRPEGVAGLRIDLKRLQDRCREMDERQRELERNVQMLADLAIRREQSRLSNRLWRLIKSHTNAKERLWAWYREPEKHRFALACVGFASKCMRVLYPRGAQRLDVAIQNAQIAADAPKAISP